MCGLVGFLQPSAVEREQQGHRHLRAMADAIVHRGPDGDGFWADASAGIFLGHRRLAILDLSPAGMQPMASPSGRYVLAFNGEVYNHGDLRARMERDGALRGPWRGHSDTETMAAGFDLWGVESTLRELVGMFAIAVWDRTERVLTLVRDRLGEKPLYF
jgi:asparagine synthase (glutamine-hydrolysing)